MGNLWSIAESEQEKQKRLEKAYGVLLPPSFVNHTHYSSNGNTTWTSSLLSQLQLYQQQANDPSLVSYLWQTHPSTCLLHDFLPSGIVLQIPIQGSNNNHENGYQNMNHLWIHLPSPSIVSAKQQSSTTPKIAPNTKASENLFEVSHTPQSQYASFLVQQKWGPWNVQLHLPTDPESSNSTTTAPYLQISRALGNHWGIGGRLSGLDLVNNNNNQSSSLGEDLSPTWIEVKYRTQFPIGRGGGGRGERFEGEKDGDDDSNLNYANLLLGSWLTWNASSIQSSWNALRSISNRDFAVYNDASAASVTSVGVDDVATTIGSNLHFQAGMEYQETLITTHVTIPTRTLSSSSLSGISTETLVSMNLNPTLPDDDERAGSQPPLWLTLKKKSFFDAGELQSTSAPVSSNWTLQLSQLWTFDRVVLNPFEDRAPQIRQTLGWAIEVEPPASLGNDDISTSKGGAPQWKAGATYQWNRGLANKVLWSDQGRVLQVGTIFKRWSAPRINLSLWKRFHLDGHSSSSSSSSPRSSWSFGMEIESGTTSRADAPKSSRGPSSTSSPNAFYPPNPNLPDPEKSAPPTKVQLPSHRIPQE